MALRVPEPAAEIEEQAETWFDFLADMGDATDPMYSVAYATMTSFDLKSVTSEVASLGTPHVSPMTWNDKIETKGFELTPLLAGRAPTLPRGRFVFFGGDAAYHVADAATLKARVQEPWQWAFSDACRHGILDSQDTDDTSHRLYGIPGNHDWYDNLRGFSRLFRLSRKFRVEEGELDQQPILLPQLEVMQLSSYVGIQLPQGWQLWGLDIDSPMDARQRDYFSGLPIPERLVVATPSPAIVFGAKVGGKESHDTHELKLDVPDVPIKPGSTPKYRLDLSGDTHHYARYYPSPSTTTYGSVVSGLGGAFHHPTFTRAHTDKPIEAQRLYPTTKDSLERVGSNLLTPASVWFSSWIRGIPLILALLFGFACASSRGASYLFAHLFHPWLPIATPNADRAQFWAALAGIAAFFGAAALVVGGAVLGRTVYRKQVKTPALIKNSVAVFFDDGFRWKRLLKVFSPARWFHLLHPYRSYWLAWALAAAGLIGLIAYPHFGPVSDNMALDGSALVIFVAFAIAAPLVAALYGGKLQSRLGKLGLGLLGLAHIGVQLLAPIFVVQFLWRGLAAVGAFAIAYLVVVGLLLLARWSPVWRYRWSPVVCGMASVIAFVLIRSGSSVVHPFLSRRVG